jgi:pimeloyl-ACP methyl ester carboxylesterase
MKLIVNEKTAYAYTANRPFDAAKPSVIFIHGAANDHSVWQMQARAFAYHGFNAFALDLPGHGLSEGEACSSIEDYAKWVVNFMDTANLASTFVVGHSMGALISLCVAHQYPARVSKLALIGACMPMPVSDALLDAAANRPNDAFDMLNIWGHAASTRLHGSPQPGVSLHGSYKRLLERSQPGVLHNDLSACGKFSLPEAQLKMITQSTLIIAGDKDLMTPLKAANLLASQLSNAKISLIEDVGHSMMGEAPAVVTGLLRGHFAAS